MPFEPSFGQLPDRAPVLHWDRLANGALKAAGGTSFLREEEDEGVALPPAGASRADTLFSAVGMILVLTLVISALWLLVRRGR